MKHFILYNPTAGHGHKPENVDLLKRDIPGECVLIDVTAPEGYAKKLSDLSPDDVITVSGGDGTLNKFINTIDPDSIPCTVYYHASGSGNDFLNDKPDGFACNWRFAFNRCTPCREHQIFIYCAECYYDRASCAYQRTRARSITSV